VSDRIVLTLPPDRALHNVARLVVGGLAVRLNLTIESLEDLQVALDGLLPEVHGEPTVAVAVATGALELTIGPYEPQILRGRLESESGDGVGLRRVLETVSDGFEVLDRGGTSWIALTKSVETAAR
jgi:hypothetical protein